MMMVTMMMIVMMMSSMMNMSRMMMMGTHMMDPLFAGDRKPIAENSTVIDR